MQSVIIDPLEPVNDINFKSNIDVTYDERCQRTFLIRLNWIGYYPFSPILCLNGLLQFHTSAWEISRLCRSFQVHLAPVLQVGFLCSRRDRHVRRYRYRDTLRHDWASKLTHRDDCTMRAVPPSAPLDDRFPPTVSSSDKFPPATVWTTPQVPSNPFFLMQRRLMCWA